MLGSPVGSKGGAVGNFSFASQAKLEGSPKILLRVFRTTDDAPADDVVRSDKDCAFVADAAKAMPGVVAAGWTSGSVEMDRTIRFAAADWREGDKVKRDKIATAVSGVLEKTLSAKAAGTAWDANTGKLKLSFKRPSQIYPALALTENVEITALVSPDKPGGSDRLMLWISSPVITTTDEGSGPKLNLSEESTGDEEGGEPKDDNGSLEALAKEFKGQRWDADRSVWK